MKFSRGKLVADGEGISARKTRERVLRETLDFFLEDPVRNRCVVVEASGERPAYWLPDGRRCAVGRYLRDVEDVERRFGDFSVAQIAASMNFDELLQADVRGIESSFWASLQYFHDTPGFWTSEGLTPTGMSMVRDLFRRTGGQEDALAEIQSAVAEPE